MKKIIICLVILFYALTARAQWTEISIPFELSTEPPPFLGEFFPKTMLVENSNLHIFGTKSNPLAHYSLYSFTEGIWIGRYPDQHTGKCVYDNNEFYDIYAHVGCVSLERNGTTLYISCPLEPIYLKPFFFAKGKKIIIAADSGTSFERYGLLVSLDSGQFFTYVPRDNYIEEVHAIAFRNDTLGYMIGNNGQVAATYDGGYHWATLLVTDPNTNYNSKIILAGEDIYTTLSSRVLRNFSEVIYWEKVRDVNINEAGEGYLVDTTGKVYKTTNKGDTWTFEMNIALASLSTERFCNSGELISYDHGNWYILSPGERKVYSQSQLTGVQGVSAVPDKFSLSQNYPNPFNPITTISFSLIQSSWVRLTVYDMTGRVIEKLLEEHKNAGLYSVTFKAYTLASGLYYYKFEAEGITETKKMMLLK